MTNRCLVFVKNSSDADGSAWSIFEGLSNHPRQPVSLACDFVLTHIEFFKVRKSVKYASFGRLDLVF